MDILTNNAKIKVITDAIAVGIGAVLVQVQWGGGGGVELRLISYASSTLSKMEKKYSQTEREALAIVWSCERFHVYFFGHESEHLTEYKPLEFILSSKLKLCARVEK